MRRKEFVPTERQKRLIAEAMQLIEEAKDNPRIPIPDRMRSPLGMDDNYNFFPVTDDDKRRDPRTKTPNEAHATGALMGLAVGDALGATLEFVRPTGQSRYPELVRGPHRDMTGGGPHRVVAGQITDDTQMAVCLFSALRDKGRKVDAKAIAKRYVAWLPHAFDAGNQTRATLALVAQGVKPHTAGKRVWLESGKLAAGNGSLMRTAPIAVFFARNQHERCTATMLDSQITHWDPRCVLACLGLNGAIASAVRGDTSVADMLHQCEDDFTVWADVMRGDDYAEDKDLVTRAEEELLEDLDRSGDDDPRLDQPGLHLYDTAGFVRVAFRLALWHLRHSDDFSASMIDIANRGGDADTNAAITGALLGARLGVDSIPSAWCGAVAAAVPSEGMKSPLAKDYHPAFMLEHVRDILGKDLEKPSFFGR